jgi:hypothetical protein
VVRTIPAGKRFELELLAAQGTQSSGNTRMYDEVETYGLLTPDYQYIAALEIVMLLRRRLTATTQTLNGQECGGTPVLSCSHAPRFQWRPETGLSLSGSHRDTISSIELLS